MSKSKIVPCTETAVEWPPINSRWIENDPRATVKRLGRAVLAHDKERGKVQLDGVVKTWAKVERFNGKRGGYTRVFTPAEDF